MPKRITVNKFNYYKGKLDNLDTEIGIDAELRGSNPNLLLPFEIPAVSDSVLCGLLYHS